MRESGGRVLARLVGSVARLRGLRNRDPALDFALPDSCCRREGASRGEYRRREAERSVARSPRRPPSRLFLGNGIV